jgi:hypothetical protein
MLFGAEVHGEKKNSFFIHSLPGASREIYI